MLTNLIWHLGNIKRPGILLKILHLDVIMLTDNPLLKLKLIITLLLIVISWQINLILFPQCFPVLADKIPKTHGDISDYMSANFSKSMGIIDTNSDEIIKMVNLPKSSFSKGADDISSVVTKKVINELYLPLSIIFNISFKLGQFPDKLKIAKIIPVFKSEDKINNYRPISILPFFSKIVERLMYNLLLNY